jgi:hypothetical protein
MHTRRVDASVPFENLQCLPDGDHSIASRNSSKLIRSHLAFQERHIPEGLHKPAPQLAWRLPDAPCHYSYCAAAAAILPVPVPSLHAPPSRNPIHNPVSVTSANSVPSTIAIPSPNPTPAHCQAKHAIIRYFPHSHDPINPLTISELQLYNAPQHSAKSTHSRHQAPSQSTLSVPLHHNTRRAARRPAFHFQRGRESNRQISRTLPITTNLLQKVNLQIFTTKLLYQITGERVRPRTGPDSFNQFLHCEPLLRTLSSTTPKSERDPKTGGREGGKGRTRLHIETTPPSRSSPGALIPSCDAKRKTAQT